MSRLPPLLSIKEIINLYKLRALKELSQNFILDQNLSKKIVRSAGRIRDAYICEVGPGPGSLTRSILEFGPAHLSVIEKDKRFIPCLQLLKEASEVTMSIHHADVLDFSSDDYFPKDKATAWQSQPPQCHIIGNLPFSISTALIIRWLNQISLKKGAWTNGRVRMTLTFQKEVAERMVAMEMEKDRCRLSVMCQNWCHVKHLFTIPGRAFVPAPDVDVGVVQFEPRIHPLMDFPFPRVEKFLRHLFHFRPKMCYKGIMTLFPPNKQDLTERILAASSVHADSKSFNLNIEDIGRMCGEYNVICDEDDAVFPYDYRSCENAKEWRKNWPNELKKLVTV